MDWITFVERAQEALEQFNAAEYAAAFQRLLAIDLISADDSVCVKIRLPLHNRRTIDHLDLSSETARKICRIGSCNIILPDLQGSSCIVSLAGLRLRNRLV